MTAALEGGEWSAARPGRTLPPEKKRYPFYRRLCGPQGRSGRSENLVLPPGFNPGPSSPWSVAILTELPGPLYYYVAILICMSDLHTPFIILYITGYVTQVFNRFWTLLQVLWDPPRREINMHYRGSTVVKVLCYKSEGRWFDSRWCHWNFSLTKSFRSHYGPGVDSPSNRNEYQEYFLWVKTAGA